MAPTKRMPREQRRRQLLEVANDIIAAEGTDALTLGRLAERAGVTKPIAYEHFGSRAGLLVALYQDYEERQNEAMRAVLAARGGRLEDAAAILAAAYVDCVLTAGPECEDLCAALSAYEETKDFLLASRELYLEEYRQALAPFADLSGPEGKALLTGILGAVETLSQAAAAGRVTREEAVGALVRLIAGALRPVPP